MTERPIIFSGPMVQAILDDRKTQTRRVLKSQPIAVIERKTGEWDCNAHHVEGIRMYHDWPHEVVRTQDQGDRLAAIPCPYGKPGDRLWVRETWKTGWGWTEPDSECIAYRADGEIRECNTHESWLCARIKTEDGRNFAMDGQNTAGRWKSSIHMPRWASRILLEVTDVRVERVQDISEEDCISWDANDWVWVIGFKRSE